MDTETKELTKSKLLPLTAFIAIASIGMSLISPLIPNYILDSGYDMSILGLISTISTFLSALLLPIAGYLSDKLGRKIIAIFTVLFRSIGTIIFFLGNTIYHIFSAQILLDLGFFLSLPAIRSMVGETGTTRQVGTAFGSVMSVTSLIYTIFPMIGGGLYTFLGYKNTFLLTSLIFVLAISPLTTYKESIERKKSKWDLKKIIRPAKKEKRILIPLMFERVAWGFWLFIVNAFPNDIYGLGPNYLGLALSIQFGSWFISQYLFGKLADKFSVKYIYIFSDFLGIPMIILMLYVKDPTILLATWALLGISIASWIPSFNKVIFKITKEEDRATTYGRIDALRNLAAFPTPYLGGFLYTTFGIGVPLYTGAAMISILLVLNYYILPD